MNTGNFPDTGNIANTEILKISRISLDKTDTLNTAILRCGSVGNILILWIFFSNFFYDNKNISGSATSPSTLPLSFASP